MTARKQSLTPTEYGEAIVNHVNRYRMSTWAAIQRIPECRSRGRRDLRRELAQLCRLGHLGTTALFRNLPYYFLAYADLNVSVPNANLPNGEHRRGPLSEQAKVRNYAMLSFCCLSHHKRQRLTADDFQRHFPDMYRPGTPLNYYIDTEASEPRLGFLRVDTGGHGRWDRILAKARADIDAHWMNSEVRPFIDRGLFEVTLITALPQKAMRMRRSLDESTDTRKRLLRICVCPDLINLIAPPPS